MTFKEFINSNKFTTFNKKMHEKVWGHNNTYTCINRDIETQELRQIVSLDYTVTEADRTHYLLNTINMVTDKLNINFSYYHKIIENSTFKQWKKSIANNTLYIIPVLDKDIYNLELIWQEIPDTFLLEDTAWIKNETLSTEIESFWETNTYVFVNKNNNTVMVFLKNKSLHNLNEFCINLLRLYISATELFLKNYQLTQWNNINILKQLLKADDVNTELKKIYRKLNTKTYIIHRAAEKQWEHNIKYTQIKLKQTTDTIVHSTTELTQLLQKTEQTNTALEEQKTRKQNLIEQYEDLINTGPVYRKITSSIKLLKTLQQYCKDFFPHMFIDYLIEENTLRIESTNNLTEWNEDNIKDCLQNTCIQYEYITREILEEKRALFYELLITQRYQITTYSCVDISLQNNSITRTNREAFPQTTIARYDSKTYWKQPHIMQYDCWGAHEYALTEFLENKDYEGMLVQLNYALSNLNLSDRYVIQNMYYQTIKYPQIQLYDSNTETYVAYQDIANELMENWQKVRKNYIDDDEDDYYFEELEEEEEEEEEE